MILKPLPNTDSTNNFGVPASPETISKATKNNNPFGKGRVDFLNESLD